MSDREVLYLMYCLGRAFPPRLVFYFVIGLPVAIYTEYALGAFSGVGREPGMGLEILLRSSPACLSGSAEAGLGRRPRQKVPAGNTGARKFTINICLTLKYTCQFCFRSMIMTSNCR